MRPRFRRRRAVAFNIFAFLLTLMALGMLYVTFSEIVTWVTSYQQTHYPVGVFNTTYLAAWAWEWAAMPAVFMISLVVGLILGARNENLRGARV